MNNKFDELAKGLAQSVTRRQALKKFGVGLAGMALACFGLGDQARAGKSAPCDGNCYCDYSRCKTLLSKKCPYYPQCVLQCACI